MCAAGRDLLVSRARELAAAGLQAARQGDFSSAERLLAEALAIDPSPATTWEARGLMAFARGAVQEARRAWRTALAHDAASRAGEWISSLQDGELQSAVAQYNRAVAHVAASRTTDALEALQRSLERCPEFLPALRLEGLLTLRLGPSSAEWDRWAGRVQRWSADPMLRALLASRTPGRAEGAGVIPRLAPRPAALRPARASAGRWALGTTAAVLVGLAMWGLSHQTDGVKTPVAGEQKPAGTAHRALPRQPEATAAAVDRRTLGIALGGSPEALAALILDAGVDSAGWSHDALQRASAVLREAGRRQYLAARSALARGEDSLAVQQLRRSVRMAQGDYYEDDALYLLMLAEQRAGDVAAARTTAARLLAGHPSSMYANSRTHRLGGATSR